MIASLWKTAAADPANAPLVDLTLPPDEVKSDVEDKKTTAPVEKKEIASADKADKKESASKDKKS